MLELRGERGTHARQKEPDVATARAEARDARVRAFFSYRLAAQTSFDRFELQSAAQSASGWPATLMVSSASTLMTGGAALLPNPPSRTVSMVDSASRPQYYCYGRSQINGLSASPQRASKTSGKRVLREPLSELPGSGPLQGKLKPPARVSLSPTKLETVMAALEIEPIESPPHVALACVQQAVEPKETRELSLERRYASWFEMAPALDGGSALNSPPGFHEAPS